MADYRSYLAANLLTESNSVTYRLLSRALKVHVNAAKEMLYEFHKLQNGKKPGTIHATYLLSGTKRREEPVATNGDHKKDGEDDYMQSSPFMSSSMPQPEESSTGETSVLTITLVREEDLEAIRSEYDQINSIHIYSLSPSPLKDLQVLSDATRQIQELTSTEDPLQTASTYGTITNKNVKRRTGRRPPPATVPIPVPVAAPKPQATKPTPAATKPEPKPSQSSTAKDFFANNNNTNAGKGRRSQPASGAHATAPGNTSTIPSNPSSKEGTPQPPALLKRDSSSIFKAFAKTKPKEVKAEEDQPMKDVSDEEDDEEEIFTAPAAQQKGKENDSGEGETESRKSRKEREAALRKMMEDDDDGDDIAEEEAESKASAVATPDVVESDPESEDPVKEEKAEEQEPTVTVSGGRRRGKRRVMKKRTVKDEEGYLVTKEEAVWESFSEEEPAPKAKPKTQQQQPPTSSSSSMNAKTKKAAAKPGQGNIMSFFGKK